MAPGGERICYSLLVNFHLSVFGSEELFLNDKLAA